MIKSFLLILTFIMAAAISGFAQSCRYNDLSKKYNYVVATVKMKDADDEQTRVKKISLQINSKANKKQIQRITIAPEYLFQSAFQSCSAARSYVTKKNKNAEANDNDYGDFIVADFNFDNNEDFAVKHDSGGNGGAFYEYYIQDKSVTFKKDAFLTDQIGYFPARLTLAGNASSPTFTPTLTATTKTFTNIIRLPENGFFSNKLIEKPDNKIVQNF